MRICYLNYDGIPTIQAGGDKRVGGLNTILFNLSTQIALQPEVRVSVVCRRDSDNSPCLEKHGDWELIRIKAGSPVRLTREGLEDSLQEFTKGSLQYIQEFQPDIIHTSGSESGEVILRFWESGVARKITWIHTNYATLAVRRVVVENKSISEALADKTGKRERMCLQSCDHVIALSEIDKNEISFVFSIPLTKITAVTPGIDENIFYPGSNLVRSSIVISAGRMSKIKDFPFLLRVFKIVAAQHEDSKLVIIGGNALEKQELGLLAGMKNLQLESVVKLMDAVSHQELASLFRQAKVFVGSSKHETFGLLPLEARACGVPCVVRANSSYLATATDGYGGYFSSNDSEEDMAVKIGRILNLSHEEWQEMSSDAVNSTKNFRWISTAQDYLEVYRKVLLQKREIISLS